MIWTRSNTLAMARERCPACGGQGTIFYPGSGKITANVIPVNINYRGKIGPCKCVLIRICRAVMAHYAYCQEFAGAVGGSMRTFYEGGATGAGQSKHRKTYSLPYQEFAADVEIISRRVLTPRDLNRWRRYYQRGEPWERVGGSHGNLHLLQARLGLAFVETRPYALFPIDEYISSIRRDSDPPLKAKAAAA